jgi:hypothetical protein
MVLCSLTWIIAFAHPGRTDSNGGHWVKTEGWGYEVGTYHYHDGSSAGQSSSSSSFSSSKSKSAYSSSNKTLEHKSNTFPEKAEDSIVLKIIPFIIVGFYALPFIYNICLCLEDFVLSKLPFNILNKYERELLPLKSEQEKLRGLTNHSEKYVNSLVPDDCIIDEKGLPKDKVDDTLKYFYEGKYTLYISTYGKKVHRRCSCHGAYWGVSAYNYYDEKDFKNMLCGRCAKNYELPPFEWYDTYLEAINSNKKYEELKNDIKKHISEINSLEKKLNKKYVYCFLTKKQKQRLSTYRNVFEDSLKS